MRGPQEFNIRITNFVTTKIATPWNRGTMPRSYQVEVVSLLKFEKKKMIEPRGPEGPEGPEPRISKMAPSTDSLFHRLLRDGNFAFASPGSRNAHVLVSPANLRLFLERRLRFNKPAIEEFFSGLEAYLEEEAEFRRALLPTRPTARTSNSSSSSSSPYSSYSNISTGSSAHLRVGQSSRVGIGGAESLVRILLGVECLQARVAGVLLERLPMYMDAADDGDSDGIELPTSMPQLILSQLRWLDTVFNGQVLSSKLLEVLSICTPDIQRDIISAIPEIVDDASHEVVVEALKDVMTNDVQLTVPVLDALSNLSLPVHIADDVNKTVLTSLESANLDDLPVVIRFLLQTSNKDNIAEIIKVLRESLSFIGCQSSSNNSRANSGSNSHGSGEERSSHGSNINSNGKHRANSGKGKAAQDMDSQAPALVIDAIKNGIRFQKALAPAFLKELGKIKGGSEHKVLDIWILFLIYSVTGHQKPTELLFRKKIVSGAFSQELLHRSITYHSSCLESMHGSILAMAEAFVRFNKPKIRWAGGRMYFYLFQSFENHFYRQEVIGNIVTHIGSTCEAEMDTAIWELREIVSNDPGKCNCGLEGVCLSVGVCVMLWA